MLGLSVSFRCGNILVRHFLQLAFFSFFSLFLMAHDQKNQAAIFFASDDQLQQKLQNFLPDQFLLAEVLYQTDGTCDLQELHYLTGLEHAMVANAKDIQNALFYLHQSQKFCSVSVELIKKDCGYDLIFHLQKQQILHRMSVSGFLRGKDRLKNSYSIDIGDPFDQQKHKHCIEQMINFLKDAGYFQAQIIDSVKIDVQTQDVAVHCAVKKGSKFKVRAINILFDNVGSVTQSEIEKLQQRIQALCAVRLHAKPYCSELIEALLKKIKWMMQHHGCIDFDIRVDQKMIPASKQVDIDLHISLERKKEFIFWGIKFFKTDQIIDHLLLYGKSTWHFPSSLIVDEVEQLYKSKGFWNVQVSVREQKDKVFCYIKEGVRANIYSIQFKNNAKINTAVLLKESCKPFLKSRYFDKDLFKKMFDQVVKKYKEFGFWDAKIIKDEFVLGAKNGSYDLIITVDEGMQKIFGGVAIPDQPELQVQLQTMVAKNLGQGFDYRWLQEQQQWIIKILKSRGYQKVAANYSLQEQGQCLQVVWKVQLCESATKFGKTLIVGNCKVPHRFLMQELSHECEQIWDKKNIEKTVQNFKSLPIFDAVQIYPGQQNDLNGCKPIFVKLVEDERYEIKTRFGLQQVGRNLQLFRGFTYKAGATLCLKNPFLRADQCVLEADMTRFYRNVAASYQFPWLFGKKIGCQWKAYDSYYQQPVYIGSQDCLYKIVQQGFLCNLTHTRDNKKLGQFILSGSAGFEAMGLYQGDQPDLNVIIDYDRNLLEKKIGYLFVEPTVLWQKVDNLLNPHRGHISFFSCKAMLDLDSKTSFFNVLVEHTQYLPIAPKVTGAIRARMGHVFNRCFDQINPIERFYLGGALTLRGYERDYTPPYGLLTKPIYDQHAGLPSCADNIWRYAPQGGRSLFNLNAEVRLNLYKNFGLVIFNDVGALFKHSIYDELKSWRDSFFAGSGFGFRYDTTLGPARFDVGYKWKIQYPDFESRCVWYLTLGQAF